ncbi:S1 family peptidase [Pseudobacteriovorax antillogorgiicola]|uniref:Trypsin-like peptidase domain-containing protein n=1 Tax=Pseudobacteriovorax antillogorgiicola TaxID=1513793 RepID=A0A1Y6BXF3_9BACT|nr:serine protease [Pseudobacteriovorax antillogorgiicola]TCS53100.1 trypsin-like peptidase [Pseudobacteriovorax antillogorgiicola]SMF25835.1 Trypsin-like peptidase domain-containing protein [Pseudobacteriovorax antillogorgiicola]
MKFAWLLALSFIATPALRSEPIPMLGSGILIEPGSDQIDDSRYQIGSEWGKKPIQESQFKELASLERVAKGTANVRGATGFYLGKFAGQHVVATNNHVCPSSWACSFASIAFKQLGKSYRTSSFIGSWPSIDLALLTIKVAKDDESLMANYALPFAFDLPLYPGQKLLTVGYGSANNSRRDMVGNWDSDCKVFSKTDEFRLMDDPDSLNPGRYKTWSFANGCDVSHGDSGSAMVDRESGQVIGIIWTGKIPKKSEIQNSDYLDSILAEESEEIWSELSYGVPAAKIKELFLEKLVAGELSDAAREVVEEML